MNILDRKLLMTLQSNPSVPVTEIAELLNMSHSACWKKIKKLELDGYIDGRAILLNQKKLGLNVTVITQVKLEQNVTQAIEEFEQSVQEYPQIVSCYSMSGESDYILRIVAKSIEDYELFLREKLANLPYVVSLNSSFTLRAVKNITTLPV